MVASKMFRVGIIGAGLMGALHARTLVSLQGVEVVAIACRTLEKAQMLAEEVGAESYSFGPPLPFWTTRDDANSI